MLQICKTWKKNDFICCSKADWDKLEQWGSYLPRHPCGFCGYNDRAQWLPRLVAEIRWCHISGILWPWFLFWSDGQSFGSRDLLQRFYFKVAALCDSLDIIRDKHPGLSRYSQESLAMRFCGNTYTAHNAQDDAIMLKRILKKADISFSDLKEHSIGKTDRVLMAFDFMFCSNMSIMFFNTSLTLSMQKLCAI